MKLLKGIFTAVVAISFLGLAGCQTLTGKEDSARRGVGQYTSDTATTANVKSALAADPTAKASQVQVDTYKGVVQLSGFVSSQAAMNRAVEIAKSTKGVKSVQNKMTLRPGATSNSGMSNSTSK